MNAHQLITLAAVDGSEIVRQLLILLVVGICVLLIWWVGKWFIEKLGGPPLAMTVWNGLFHTARPFRNRELSLELGRVSFGFMEEMI